MSNIGQKWPHNRSWLSDVLGLASGVTAASGTGPTAADCVSGEILLTGPENAAAAKLHIWVVLEGGDSAMLHVWGRVRGTDNWCAIRDNQGSLDWVVSKAHGQHFLIDDAPPTAYRIGVSDIASGALLSIYYQFTE